MAKKPKISTAGVNMVTLATIANGTVTHLSQAEGLPLFQHVPALIEVNTGDLDPAGNAAVRLTAAGNEMVAAGALNAGGGKPDTKPAVTKFAIMSNVVPPASMRGAGLKHGTRSSQYPFEDLQIGQSFFVPVSADIPDPVKTIGSTVSSANMRYRTETGETVSKTRIKRGSDHKAVKDAAGNPVKETVTVPVYKQDRKFIIRPIKTGVKYGEWTADADGALVARVELSAE